MVVFVYLKVKWVYCFFFWEDKEWRRSCHPQTTFYIGHSKTCLTASRDWKIVIWIWPSFLTENKFPFQSLAANGMQTYLETMQYGSPMRYSLIVVLLSARSGMISPNIMNIFLFCPVENYNSSAIFEGLLFSKLESPTYCSNLQEIRCSKKNCPNCILSNIYLVIPLQTVTAASCILYPDVKFVLLCLSLWIWNHKKSSAKLNCWLFLVGAKKRYSIALVLGFVLFFVSNATKDDLLQLRCLAQGFILLIRYTSTEKQGTVSCALWKKCFRCQLTGSVIN